MTEERKQELRQLLTEAMMCLEIRRSGTEPSLLPMEVYRIHLQRYWTSYSEDLGILSFDPHIVSETTKSKLLDFIRLEFDPFIHDDRIQSASFFILIGSTDGYPLDSLLKQLLKIAIVGGIEGAISAFDRCTKETHAPFQYIALLEGIRVKAEIQVFERMRLVPLPHSTSELSHYLRGLSRYHFFDMSEHSFIGKTLLIIDASASPIFCKPFPELYQEGFREGNFPFRVKIDDEKFPHFYVLDFYEKFCQALSLTCNSAVQIPLGWRFLAEDELYNLNFGMSGGQFSIQLNPVESTTEVGETQIEEAKRLYHILINLDANIREKLRIPIDRWIQSKTSGNSVDKMIDLGIAFESIYLSDIKSSTELAFRLRLHAACYLGKDKKDRKALMKEFQKIYDWRSLAVHTGKLPNKIKKRPLAPEDITKFIERAQDLCWESIIRIMEDGQFPDWNDLILGGDAGSDLI